MWGTCKIVNFSLLLFSTLVIGQNLLTQKNTLSKWSVNAFYCVNGLHVGWFMHSLCKNESEHSYVGKAPLPHNKRNCYISTLRGSLLNVHVQYSNDSKCYPFDHSNTML